MGLWYIYHTSYGTVLHAEHFYTVCDWRNWVVTCRIGTPSNFSPKILLLCLSQIKALLSRPSQRPFEIQDFRKNHPFLLEFRDCNKIIPSKSGKKYNEKETLHFSSMKKVLKKLGTNDPKKVFFSILFSVRLRIHYKIFWPWSLLTWKVEWLETFVWK